MESKETGYIKEYFGRNPLELRGEGLFFGNLTEKYPERLTINWGRPGVEISIKNRDVDYWLIWSPGDKYLRSQNILVPTPKRLLSDSLTVREIIDFLLVIIKNPKKYGAIELLVFRENYFHGDGPEKWRRTERRVDISIYPWLWVTPGYSRDWLVQYNSHPEALKPCGAKKVKNPHYKRRADTYDMQYAYLLELRLE
ncbi:MAG: hypothetical protein KAQ63_01495 [Candidatus Moranbacteria bacterium]|nr:hypothetical protein [Candidatus Moranbacteria bacterium]